MKYQSFFLHTLPRDPFPTTSVQHHLVLRTPAQPSSPLRKPAMMSSGYPSRDFSSDDVQAISSRPGDRGTSSDGGATQVLLASR